MTLSCTVLDTFPGHPKKTKWRIIRLLTWMMLVNMHKVFPSIRTLHICTHSSSVLEYQVRARHNATCRRQCDLGHGLCELHCIKWTQMPLHNQRQTESTVQSVRSNQLSWWRSSVKSRVRATTTWSCATTTDGRHTLDQRQERAGLSNYDGYIT